MKYDSYLNKIVYLNKQKYYDDWMLFLMPKIIFVQTITSDNNKYADQARNTIISWLFLNTVFTVDLV